MKASKSLIVSDTGPLIALARIDHLQLLSNLYKEIIIPKTVFKECTLDLNKPGAKIIQACIEKNMINVFQENVNLEKNFLELSQLLGEGEVDAMKLAISLKSKLLIDDLAGRKVAQKLGISIIGIIGILVTAKKKKIISKTLPLLQELKKFGYRLSDELIEYCAQIDLKE